MGQDRKFTDEEVNFALDCVKFYKETWEKTEKDNLHKDVMFKLSNIFFDKNDREHYENQDSVEIERIIDEAIQEAQNEKMAQGEDDMTDTERENITKKAKYDAYKMQFWAPEKVAEFKAKLDNKS